MADANRADANRADRPRIAVFAGPDATILNSQPLVTSDKARARRGLPPRAADPGGDGEAGARRTHFDALRPQRLAAPVTVYVEQFSAHPLEADAAGLYAPPDGYVDRDGVFSAERRSPGDVPVYEMRLEPGDGLYPLPYMAFQADGRPWEGDEADPFGPPDRTRQPFYPDASRVFEEIDRFGVGEDGVAGQLSALADFEFVRAAPPGGYAAHGEERGRDYFPYRPVHLIRQPSRLVLGRLTNAVQAAMGAPGCGGGLWLEGSPYVEETAWWLNLLIDTPLPIAACAAQQPHGGLGSDGDLNILDAVRYITSRVWADDSGRDGLGAVVVIDRQILASRAVQKGDARPGGYVATGGQGGVLGTISSTDRPTVAWWPRMRHTWSSDVRLSVLPEAIEGVRRGEGGGAAIERVRVAVRGDDGSLVPAAIPTVTLVKHGQYTEESDEIDPSQEVHVLARLARDLETAPLAGFVAEGSAPFATLNESVEAALRQAVFSGLPVVKVGRGNADGVSERTYAPFAIAGGNLTATKARLLLMAGLLKLGALPPAADPTSPTQDEMRATRKALDAYQVLFDTH